MSKIKTKSEVDYLQGSVTSLTVVTCIVKFEDDNTYIKQDNKRKNYYCCVKRVNILSNETEQKHKYTQI